MALTPEQLQVRNQKIREHGAKTRATRKTQLARTRELKLKPNKTQKEVLTRLFLEAKWYRNAALASGLLEKFDPKIKTVEIKTPCGLEARSLTVLGSHHKQAILQELAWNKKALAVSKARGRKIGGLKFTSQVNSLHLKQLGVTYQVDGKRVRLQGIKGWVPALGARQLANRELASAKLVRRASGYYLSITTYAEKEDRKTLSTPIGVDMGVATHVTLSDGRKFNSVLKESERLRRLQRKLQRQVKGSSNHWKTRQLIQREYEKLGNKKKEWVNQLVAELSRYETVYYQDEQLASWRKLKKSGLHHSGLGYLKGKLAQLGNSVMLSQWEPTTQFCGECGMKTKHPLTERVFRCACGLVEDRDVHAARNMILLGSKISLGQELSVAPVEDSSAAVSQFDSRQDDPVKQETNTLGSCVEAGQSPSETQRSSVVA